MLFTIFCCISTGLSVYCIFRRVNQRAVEIAVRLAVRDIEKEFEGREAALMAQLGNKLTTKESELKKARDLVRLHEAVPSSLTPVKAAAKPSGKAAALSAKEKLRREGLEAFAMSRPFTDTAYDALLAGTEVVKVEPAGM
ncbi:MAG TPA: hypothetical protein VH041_08115 [Caldimonas sp.]|jgi:hypothetical protein|nr:hypothetical protein [Caldimonas sp.]HEX4234259.1 hypothetical protein [Caldimonas sp.]